MIHFVHCAYVGKQFLQATSPIPLIESSTKIVSSPEPKAQGELLWSLTVRRRRPYVRPSVHNL